MSRDRRHRPTWAPQAGTLDWGNSGPFDAVIHLAGENIATGRWTWARKQRIRSSRVLGTRLLAEHLAASTSPPRVLIAASAVGFYGNQGDQWLEEEGPAGEGFLAEVCQAWEDAAEPARAAGIRVVHLRLGVVLARQGGFLSRLLPLFRWGLGGMIGSGAQYLSWVTLEDVVRVIEFVLKQEGLSGPLNVCAPEPVTNRDFTQAMGKVLHRPTFFHVPAFMIKILLGEMGRELILTSQRVRPRVLMETGFEFDYSEIGKALAEVVTVNE